MTLAVIGQSIPEQLVASVFDVLEALDATITCLLGRRSSEQNTPPHSVIAIPLGSALDDHDMKPGGAPWGDNAGRQLMLRHFRIEWQCHDGPDAPGLIPDFTNAEALYLNTVVAIRNCIDASGTPFHNAVQFDGEEWTDQQQNEDSYERSGTLIKFFTTMDLPVYDSPPRLVHLTNNPPILTTVTELDQTVTINEGAT